ncbi:long-chain-acyl-CoA synthetase [Demetria terragena]|uniref:long-chain-acyl-CoA synthetase n=1 Tax=Demetria terragena TaxID=63959 RepID=UPI00035EDF19|nr:long-chain-acyl-CoA synthetase [Demetria terragena]
MTSTTRQRVGLTDLAKGAAAMRSDLPALLKAGAGLILRKPGDQASIGRTFQDLAAKQPDNAFLVFEDQELTYGEANAVVNRYAAVLTERGADRGGVVGIMGGNELDTLLVTLAAVKIGSVAGLLNHHQRGDVLGHSLGILDARLIVVADGATEDLATAGEAARAQPALTYSELRSEAEGKSTDNPAITEQILGSERAFYIFTSGTTGMPKASIMTHFRWLKSYSGLGGLGVRLKPTDRMYSCLPLYHNNAITVALGAVLAGGASYAIGRKFSASGFWEEARRYDATAFVYIGELCRYLLAQPERPGDRDHRVRVIVGNGLRPDIWRDFQGRFGIERIAEFYGASECNIAFINAYGIDETAGTCPLPFSVVAYDQDAGEPVRDAKGRLTKVKAGEIGLLLAKVTSRAPFDGYTDDDATERKLIRGGFRSGDCWFNTGDLVINQGFTHVAFVDRLGDTFRWKGENVATTEVEAVLGRQPQIEDCSVYGVEVPGTDGRAGMAAVVLAEGADLDPSGLATTLRKALPAYAVPLFIRVVDSLEHTSTFKSIKVKLRSEGYEVGDDVFAFVGGDDGYVPFYADYPADVAAARAPR